MAGDRQRIGEAAKTAIAAADSTVIVSAVTVWEVAIKRRLGNLEAPGDLLLRIERAGVPLLSVTARHADRIATLPMHHADPFDRLLVAQAEIEGLRLVSADELIPRYGVEVVW